MPARDFESIYADYSRMVYWAAYGVLKNESDAMDASQNVFLRVIKHQKSLKQWRMRSSKAGFTALR